MTNNIYWFDHIWDRVDTVFVQQLVHRGRCAAGQEACWHVGLEHTVNLKNFTSFCVCSFLHAEGWKFSIRKNEFKLK